MADLKKIKEEQENLVALYEEHQSFLNIEVLEKSRELDQMIVSYLQLKLREIKKQQ